MPNSAQLASRTASCLADTGSATGLSMSTVGTLWSAVAMVRSGRWTLRPASRSPSNAWGEVTSCTRWRSMNSTSGSSAVPRWTTWRSQTFSDRVRGTPSDRVRGESVIGVSFLSSRSRPGGCRRGRHTPPRRPRHGRPGPGRPCRGRRGGVCRPRRHPPGRDREDRKLTPMTDSPRTLSEGVPRTLSEGVTRTLSEQVWDRHVVHRGTADEPDVLFIDLHLVHEVTSPQAFDGLRLAGRSVHRPDLTIATADHNVPTVDIDKPVADPVSARQLAVLDANCAEFGITCYPMGDANQGIVHIIGPEQGLTQPGMTIVCGDSHTSTHGAFGALAFGIGTSEVEHVLATQTLPQRRPATMAVTVDGELPPGVTAKDLVLAVIGRIGTGGGSGHIIEYRGSAVRGLSMEGRMTVCNMSIEAGARAGMIAPDETTFAYLEGRDHAPKGAAWEVALADWGTLPTDPGAAFDKEVVLDASSLAPYVTWGTNPAQVTRIDGTV